MISGRPWPRGVDAAPAHQRSASSLDRSRAVRWSPAAEDPEIAAREAESYADDMTPLLGVVTR